MAKPEEQAQPQSTNALLAAILNQEQANGATLNSILTTENASAVLLKQISDALTGGEFHQFTVLVKQLINKH